MKEEKTEPEKAMTERAEELAALAERFEAGEDISDAPEDLQRALRVLYGIAERLH